MRLSCIFDFFLFNFPGLRGTNRVDLTTAVRYLSHIGGPPTGIVCQSESWLTSEGVCSLTHGDLLLSVTPVREWSWEESSGRFFTIAKRQNNSHPNFDLLFMSWRNKSGKDKRNKLACMLLLYCCIMLDFYLFIYFYSHDNFTFLTWFDI